MGEFMLECTTMTRTGVIVAMLALAGTAVADKTPAAKKAAPAKADPKAKAPPPAPNADDAAPAEGGEDAPDPMMALPHVTGPKLVDLGNSVEIDLPAGFVLYEKTVAQDLIRKGGGSVEGVMGAVLKPGTEWSVVLYYNDIGYVTDDDADQLDASELLDQYKQGTIEQNKTRKSMGIPELFIDGWSEKPAYSKPSHHLTWGLDGHDSDGKVINFITRILGRNGYISFDLIASPDIVVQSKQEAAPVLAGTRFKAGARYEDHKSEDKSSGLGLRTLIIGGAGVAVASKAGFFLKLLIALKKGVILIFAGIAGFFKWLFGKKKKDGPELPPDPSAPPPNV